jgi:hypothetical protein
MFQVRIRVLDFLWFEFIWLMFVSDFVLRISDFCFGTASRPFDRAQDRLGARIIL